MLYFQPVRTARFTFTLQELTIEQIRTLLDMSQAAIEKARSEFLRSALKSFQWHQGYEKNTLEHLTAQERLFIEATYLSSVSEQPDFKLSNGHYTDFLQVEKQYKLNEVELGQIQGDDDLWFIQPLTGAMLEVIEERLLMQEKVERADWFLYAMAAQLYRQNEEQISPYLNGINYGDWLDERAERLQKLPESAFISLFSLFITGMGQLLHLFSVNFDHKGLVIMPIQAYQKTAEGEEVELLPARFRPTHAITLPTQRLFGKSEQDGE